MRYLIVFLLVLASGCPIRVEPPTGSVCPSKPNCGQCVAMAPCAWCPSSNGTLRGCFARGHRADCNATVIEDANELCPEDATGRQ
jgi:hypothetical protein